MTSKSRESSPIGLRRWLPILQWLPHYDRGWLRGDVIAGLAVPRLPDVTWQEFLRLVPGALGITLVIFAEGIGPMRTFAGKYRYPVDANQELIGLGVSNAGAGLFQSFAVGVSLSRSAANNSAGARSQVSGLVAAALTIVVALFLTPLFTNLPEATLAAIVVVAVARMFKWKTMRDLYRVRRSDFVLAMVALLGVLTFQEVLTGLLVAVIVSLLALVWRASQARVSVLGRLPGANICQCRQPARECDCARLADRPA